jgi:hypothetical protein
MSYSIRNTIILAITALLLASAAGVWLQFYQISPLEDSRDRIEQQKQEISRMQAEVAGYQQLSDAHSRVLNVMENVDVSLFPGQQLPVLYDYVRRADPANIVRNFSFADSTSHGDYGIIRFHVDGTADYRNLRDYIYTLEAAGPIVEITELNLRNSGDSGNLHMVDFRFGAIAYYTRTSGFEELAYAEPVRVRPQPHNPLYPLVHDIRPNEQNLPNAERSSLVAVSRGQIYLRDQSNQVVSLREGDRVYNGYVKQIDFTNKTATFFLNKGGITELIELRL